MALDDFFPPFLAMNPAGGVVPNAEAVVYAASDPELTTPLQITDVQGVPVDVLVASPDGIYPAFKTVDGTYQVLIKSGDHVTAHNSLYWLVQASGLDPETVSAAIAAGASVQEAVAATQEARDLAVQAAADAAAVGATTDAVMTAVATDPGSAFAGAQREAIAGSVEAEIPKVTEVARRYSALTVRPADAFPPAMAIEPRFDTRSDATNIVTRKVWALNAPIMPLRWHGGPKLEQSDVTLTIDGTTYPCYVGGKLTDAGGSPASFWEFYSDAPVVMLGGYFHNGSAITLEVDGRAMSSGALTPTGSYVRVDWAGVRKVRHYRFYAFDGFRPAVIVTAPTDSVWPAPATNSLLGLMGDSFMGGTASPGYRPHSISYLIAQMLGFDLALDQIGGTGYMTPNGFGNFQTRVTRNFSTLSLSAMLWAGGINDPAAGLQAAAQNAFEAFADTHPDTPQIVLGPWSPSGTYESQNVAKWTAVAAAAAAVGAVFIDTRGWVAGTGRQGALTGDGNADFITSTDATHPTYPAQSPTNGVGTAYLATRAAQAIQQRIAQGVIQ